jgi:hypothetical protein
MKEETNTTSPRPVAAFGLRVAALAGILVAADGLAATAAWAGEPADPPHTVVAAIDELSDPPPAVVVPGAGELPEPHKDGMEVNPSTCC